MGLRKLFTSSANILLAKCKLTIIPESFFSNGLDPVTLKAFGLNEGAFFDVGANRGEMTDIVADRFESCHLFEPNKTLFQKLELKYSQSHGIKVNCLGVSDSTGGAVFYQNNNADHVSSLEPQRLHQCEVINIKTISIDEYCANQGVKSIGLLKIDVEGHEKSVIKGSSKMLSTKRVKGLLVECTLTPEVILSSDFMEISALLSEFSYVPQGFYEPWYGVQPEHKGVFKIANVLFVEKSNPYFQKYRKE